MKGQQLSGLAPELAAGMWLPAALPVNCISPPVHGRESGEITKLMDCQEKNFFCRTLIISHPFLLVKTKSVTNGTFGTLFLFAVQAAKMCVFYAVCRCSVADFFGNLFPRHLIFISIFNHKLISAELRVYPCFG